MDKKYFTLGWKSCIKPATESVVNIWKVEVIMNYFYLTKIRGRLVKAHLTGNQN